MTQAKLNTDNLTLRWQVWRMSTNVARPGAGIRQLVAAFAERDDAQEFGEDCIAIRDDIVFDIVDCTTEANT